MKDNTLVDDNENKIVFRHRSFFGDNYDDTLNNGHNICLIPNIEYKVRTLNNQYYNNNWFQIYFSFRQYVESSAEGDDVRNFWGWLFNKLDFNNLKPWNLPFEYINKYKRFLQTCDNIDKNIL